MKFEIQLQVTIEVEAKDARDALPVALGYLQEAMDWASERYEGDEVKAVGWTAGRVGSVSE